MSSRYGLIVAGSRRYRRYHEFRERLIEHLLLLKHQGITEVTLITGRAKQGPDDMAYHFARWDRPMAYLEMKADWQQGRGAGMSRNSEMAEIGDGLLAYWDGESSGTRHMVATMKRLKKDATVYIERLDDDPTSPLEIVRFS